MQDQGDYFNKNELRASYCHVCSPAKDISLGDLCGNRQAG